MTHGSLFSGIGGFDLAAAWAGWTNVFNCEIDPFCRRVLKYHFPESEQYEDIRTTDFTVWRDCIDVLTGGFPCQPFSLAGKRKGTADDRYLWPAMLGVVRTVRPRWVVGENVLGIVNWSQGMVFEQVCADLEAAGYEVHGICDYDEETRYSIDQFKAENVAKGHPAIDCGENIELFKALAAMNDENDYMQWYVNEITDRWSLCIGMDHVEDDPIISKWEGLARHKATAEEIIKHFKK